ncbi:MAG: DUF4276 family protein [Deltaproteobacteria bacterium]|nr:DUF4276 family protein [Deltaproteobacteria bacterium]
MTVSHVEVLIEEPSMEAALRLLLPKILGGASFGIYTYQCKDDLMEKLPERLRGYSSWLPADNRIVVVMDRDDEDCHALKDRLEKIAAGAGLITRSKARTLSYQVVNRLAIEELEAWYFGDWDAVKAAYPRISHKIPIQARYRDPDAIAGGTWEAFERILQHAGYFKNGLRKIEAARAVAQHWQPGRNRSRSFHVFHEALHEMAVS